MPDITSVVRALILGRPLCVECIREKVGVPAYQVRAAIERLEKTEKLQQSPRERCHGCGNIGPVTSVDR